MTDLLERDAERLEDIAASEYEGGGMIDADGILIEPEDAAALRRAARLMRLVGKGQESAAWSDAAEIIGEIGADEYDDMYEALHALSTYGSEEGEGDDE